MGSKRDSGNLLLYFYTLPKTLSVPVAEFRALATQAGVPKEWLPKERSMARQTAFRRALTDVQVWSLANVGQEIVFSEPRTSSKHSRRQRDILTGKPGDRLRQIGRAVFDPETGTVQATNVAGLPPGDEQVWTRVIQHLKQRLEHQMGHYGFRDMQLVLDAARVSLCALRVDKGVLVAREQARVRLLALRTLARGVGVSFHVVTTQELGAEELQSSLVAHAAELESMIHARLHRMVPYERAVLKANLQRAHDVYREFKPLTGVSPIFEARLADASRLLDGVGA